MELLRAAEDLTWECAQIDPWFFMRTLALTLDEHDAALPYKNFPEHAYLEQIVRILEREQFTAIPKSRQVMVTWLCITFCLWWGMNKSGQLILFQSKKEEDANRMIDRVWGIYERLPQYVKDAVPAEHSYLKIKFPTLNSKIEGIPQGADQIRSNTPSVLFSDEMAFQDEAEASFAAALPALQGARGGGRGIFASSAAPGFFQELATEDVQPGTVETLVKSWSTMQGLVAWRTITGMYVVHTHYSADPDKTDAWAEQAALLFPGGRTGKQWRAENEIDWFARSGGRIFEDFSLGTHVVKPFDIPAHWRVYRGVDYGLRNPTSCIWVAVDDEGCMWVFDEYYRSGASIPEHAQAIKAKSGRRKIQYSVIDPATMAHTINNSLSVAEQFAKEGLFFNPGDNRVLDGIAAMQEMFRIQEYGFPLLRVFDTCPKLIEELLGYRWLMQMSGGNNEKDPREAPVKKNDHGVDALRYIVMTAPGSMVAKATYQRFDRELSVHERIEKKVRMARIERELRETF